MARVISVHEYVLKPDVASETFEQAVCDAATQGCFDLPGLVSYQFVRRLRGSRPAMYAAIWTYEDQAAWAKLWGDVEGPKPRERFPDRWKVWENDILEPLIDRDPQFVEYAAYEEYGD